MKQYVFFLQLLIALETHSWTRCHAIFFRLWCWWFSSILERIILKHRVHLLFFRHFYSNMSVKQHMRVFHVCRSTCGGILVHSCNYKNGTVAFILFSRQEFNILLLSSLSNIFHLLMQTIIRLHIFWNHVWTENPESIWNCRY